MDKTVAAREAMILALCIALVVLNAAVAVICLVLRPCLGTRLLGALTGHFNTLIAAAGVAFAAGGCIGVVKVDLIPYVKVYLVLLGELAILRLISYYRFQDRSALWWPEW